MSYQGCKWVSYEKSTKVSSPGLHFWSDMIFFSLFSVCFQGVRVHILNMGSPTGRLIFNVMLAFAEFERDMIVERTQEGKAIAKQNPNFQEGRPKIYGKEQIEHAIKLKETLTYKQVENKTGISKSTLIRARRERGLIYSQ